MVNLDHPKVMLHPKVKEHGFVLPIEVFCYIFLKSLSTYLKDDLS